MNALLMKVYRKARESGALIDRDHMPLRKGDTIEFYVDYEAVSLWALTYNVSDREFCGWDLSNTAIWSRYYFPEFDK